MKVTTKHSFLIIQNSQFHVLALTCVLIAAQLHDLMQLKQENSYLTTIARQISPYILSIAKVKERLEPRCCNSAFHSFKIRTKLRIKA